MEMELIARIRTDFKEKFGIPRQSGCAKRCIGRVVLEPKYRNPDTLRGLESLSHTWILFDFQRTIGKVGDRWYASPGLGGNEKVGVFASRSHFRPNLTGLSSVRLMDTERTEKGDALLAEGADFLNGTPVYDTEPYMRHSDSHVDAVSDMRIPRWTTDSRSRGRYGCSPS